MITKNKTLWICLAQYVALLFFHTLYAYTRMGGDVGEKVLVAAVLGMLVALIAACLKWEPIGSFFIFTSVLADTWYIGTEVHTMEYSFVVFLATGLIIATYVRFWRNIIFWAATDIVLIISALFQWESYGTQGNYFIFLIIFLCYNFANATLCVLVKDLQKRIHLLHDKTKEAIAANESKGNFLANMSHEIRTPMNAISGLNQLILQETIPDEVREKSFGIQTACSDLMTIVNDILDFTKIESGKMEIVPAEYETKDMIQDTVNLIYLRKEEMSVEVLVDIACDLPKRLYGDDIRVKQVIMNLLTNAVKFTHEGYVSLKMDWIAGQKDLGGLKVEVEDTGIGIRQEEIGRLFESFEQVDTKRNRKVEGSGLGLAISKQLVDLMGGSISVQSEYGKGSKFTVFLPQKRVGEECVVHFKNRGESSVIYTHTTVFQKLAEKMFAEAKVPCTFTTSFVEVKQMTRDSSADYYFVSDSCYEEHPEFFQALSRRKKVIILQERNNDLKVPDGIKVVYRPFYSIPLEAVFSGEKVYGMFSKEDVWDFKYIAPKARVLVVDDNDVNLHVTVGLMGPLKMQVQTAESGYAALEIMKKQPFDLVFMDHMMPGMDGIETVERIRSWSKEDGDYFATVPIVALTANAVGGAREQFLENGFQDFLAKPIELRELDRLLKKWLPSDVVEEKTAQELMIKEDGSEVYSAEKAQKKWPVQIPGLDLDVAKHFFGNDATLFYDVISDFYYSGKYKRELVNEAYLKKDWATYAREAHSLKSLSKSVGALVLAEHALEMENAAKQEREDIIREKYEAYWNSWGDLLHVLSSYVEEEEAGNEMERELLEEQKPLMRLKELKRRVAELGEYIKEERTSLTENEWEQLQQKISEMEAYRYSRKSFLECIRELSNTVKKRDVNLAKKALKHFDETI